MICLLSALLFVITLCYFLSRWVIGRIYKYLLKTNNKELIILATIGLAFIMLTVRDNGKYIFQWSCDVIFGASEIKLCFALQLTNSLRISMELGCFLAGVTVSAQGHGLVEQIELLMGPVKDVFACLFFASIGNQHKKKSNVFCTQHYGIIHHVLFIFLHIY